MIKIKLTIITILILCDSSAKSNVNDNKSLIDNKEQVAESQINKESTTEVPTQVDSRATGFVKKLKAREKLSSYFNDNWIFIYHEDNRCDGSTDGQLNNLNRVEIDSIIRLQVKNDGEGWGCEKKEPKTYGFDFDLKRKIKDWDRFEIPNYENKEENIVYVVGAGESDYLKLHYNHNNLIIKLEYRSEDPG